MLSSIKNRKVLEETEIYGVDKICSETLFTLFLKLTFLIAIPLLSICIYKQINWGIIFFSLNGSYLLYM